MQREPLPYDRLRWYGNSYQVAALCTYLGLALVNCPVCARDPTAAAPAASNIYQLQYLISFDCLDGVRVDRAQSTIALFGHQSNPDHLLHVAYFDYLATALDQRQSPSISIEPTPGFYEAERQTIDFCSHAILQDVTHLYDQEGKLNENSGWFFQQLGVTISSEVRPQEALSRMLRVTGHKDLADLYHLKDAIATSGSNAPEASRELCKLLGMSSSWQDISDAYSAGTISQEQEQDEKNTVYLRAVGLATVMEPNKYTKLYHGLTKGGLPPAQALAHLEQNEMREDAAALQTQVFGELLAAKREIPVPPWIAESTLSTDFPRVHPVFENVATDSWLARTLFQGDVTLKSIVSLGLQAESPLKTLVPGYRSEREFMQAKGLRPDNGRIRHQRAEIIPGSFEITESAERDSMQFGSTPMKIVVMNLAVDQDGSHKDADDAAVNEYAAEITARYDDLARVFPTLHKLREAAKIVAVARWIQKRGIQLPLPKDGRLSWKPPESFPAMTSARLEVGSGNLVPYVNLSGGVELAPDKNWQITQGVVIESGADTRVAVPVAPSVRPQESDLRQELQRTPGSPQKAALELKLAVMLVARGETRAAMIEIDRAIPLDPNNTTLLLLAAQAHHDAGDSAGAVQAMQAYLQGDPQNIPARRMLAHFQQASDTNRPSDPTRNAKAATVGAVKPFEWNGPISRAVYAMDERAPELPEIHIAPFEWNSPPPPRAPPISDCIALRPEIVAFREKRAQLVRDYQQAKPDVAPAILTKIKQVDAQVIKRTIDLSVSFDDEAPAPPPAEKPDGAR